MLGIGLCAIMFLLLNDLVDTVRRTLAIKLPMTAQQRRPMYVDNRLILTTRVDCSVLTTCLVDYSKLWAAARRPFVAVVNLSTFPAALNS